jgi:translation initiation factor IF-2
VLEECCGSDISWERLMLTVEQVREHNLPFVIKKDGRLKHCDISRARKTWECEALSQKLIVDLLEARLQELLQPFSIEGIRAEEAEQRTVMLKKLKRLKA